MNKWGGGDRRFFFEKQIKNCRIDDFLICIVKSLWSRDEN